MFLGHFAVALAAKKAVPKVSLGTLFLSVGLVDFVWPLFLLLGIEHVRISQGVTVVTPLDFYDYPFTHSLLTSIGWSLLAGGVYFAIKRDLRASLVVGVAVLSHWILDLLVHGPDLPLVPGESVKLGMGLWNSLPATMVVEFGLFGLGWYVYSSITEERSRAGRISFWSWSFFVVLVYIGNLFGPPPPDVTSLSYMALILWLFIPWGYYIDHERRMRAPAVAE